MSHILRVVKAQVSLASSQIPAETVALEAAAKLLHLAPEYVAALARKGLFGKLSPTPEAENRLPLDAVLAYRQQLKAQKGSAVASAPSLRLPKRIVMSSTPCASAAEARIDEPQEPAWYATESARWAEAFRAVDETA